MTANERTKEYVRYLGIGSLPQCEKNKRLLELQNMVIEHYLKHSKIQDNG